MGKKSHWSARILAVAESFDALTTRRPYKKAISPNEAIAVLKEEAGKAYDLLVVDALVRIASDLPKEAWKALPEVAETYPAPRQSISIDKDKKKGWCRLLSSRQSEELLFFKFAAAREGAISVRKNGD